MSSEPDATDNPSDESLAKSRKFQCQNCGGDLNFDPEAHQLRCQSCGQLQSIERKSTTIVEYDLMKGLESVSVRGFGLPTRTLSCQSCGAIISFGATETAGSCSFCASSQVLELESHRQVVRPESVVPFRMKKDQATAAFQTWLKRLWFRPNNLKKLAEVSLLNGVYIPYWVFDATVESEWKAMAGFYYYTTETYTEVVNGQSQTRTRQVRHTRWQPASGFRTDIFDDYLVCASKGLPESLVSKLDSFSTRDLQPYDPSFLAGWKAEEYQLDLRPAWDFAVHEMESIQDRRCSQDVPGDTQMGLHVENRFFDTRFKHVLLPIWIAAYRYKDKSFQFLVNGQTGEVEGHAPYSAWKITFAVLIFMAFLLAMILVGSSQSQY